MDRLILLMSMIFAYIYVYIGSTIYHIVYDMVSLNVVSHMNAQQVVVANGMPDAQEKKSFLHIFFRYVYNTII